ncbi:MAG: phosphoadenylyl-sulfate reductase [Terriglobales bacterium]
MNAAADASGLALVPGASPEEILAAAFARWGEQVVLVTSWQAEGMVLVDMVAGLGFSPRVLTIDTGRLPEETHAFMAEVQRRYRLRLQVAAPAAEELAALLAGRGANAFYQGPLDRHLCCEIRKSRVLDRLLRPPPGAVPVAAWVSGLRRSQGPARRQVRAVEADARHPGLWRLAPLAAWSEAQVEGYTNRHAVPRHPLYARGFRSIGCAPCTRPTSPGESPRAGRWWWERDGKKECGLHDADRPPEFDVALAGLLSQSTGESLAS